MAEPPSAVVLGFDVGVSKAVVAYAPAGATSFGAELVPNETSSVTTPTAVAFQGRERHVGDVAVGQLGTNAANAIAGLLPLLGLPLDAAAASDAFSRARLEAAPDGAAAARVSYMGDDVPLRAEQLTAMLLARLAAHAANASGNATVRRCVLSCPPAFTPRQRRALLDAAVAAGLPSPSLLPAHAAAASCFGVKRPSAEGSAPRRVAFCDVGQHYASVAVYDFAFRAAPRLLASGGEALGAGDLDEALWELCASELRDKHRIDVTKASRGGGRLLAEVVKAKRTLSTVASATIELECFGPDEKDVKLAITRDRFDAACAPLRERLEAFLRATFAAAAAAAGDDAAITAVEVIGGAARVPWVAAAIATAAGAPLSHMLDGACSCALGAAFAAQAHIDDRAFPAAFPPPVVAPDDEAALPAGLDADALASLRAAELEMARADAEAAALADAWNELEAYVLEMRACASSGPLAADLQPAATLPLLAAAEDWMLDARDSGEDVPLADVRARLEDVRSKLHELAPGYFAKLAAQKAALEAELAAANAVRQAETTHEDHDTRPLRKAERLRLASNNKDEGTQLFKDGNMAPAIARWGRALEHTTKFIDLTPEDKPEIDALVLSLHLNIAMALLRLADEGSLRRCVESTTAALAIEASNAKALYRRACAQNGLRQFDAARADLVAAEAAEPGDKAVAALLKTVEGAIAAQKQKEKAVYGKMFG